MARGRFGHSRGRSTNLTALIAGLLREQRQAEDRAMFDAYKNGGLYKGKPVDDARILGYMKSRRDGFSTDDPLYDEWNNRLIQTKFSIGEQKIGLAFKQGKVGAGAVASFYRNQLKSIPQNSEFYRDVAGRAAQWAKSAGGAARGRARGRASAGARAGLNKQLEQQQNYLALEAALTAYARRQGLISGTQKLADADATDLQEMFNRGIYSDKDRITFEDFRAAAKGHYTALGAEINTRLAMGQQAVEARNKRSRFLDETLVRLNAIDDRGKYEMAREVLDDQLNAANGDPYASRAAYDAYAKSLQGIHEVATRPGAENANDPEFVGGLVNEFNAVTTGKNTGATVADIYDMDDGVGGAKELVEFVTKLSGDLDKLESGKAYYGQTEPGGPLSVVDWPVGTGSNPLGLDDSLQPSISSSNGERRVVYLKGERVAASFIMDNNTGQPVDMSALSPEQLRAGLASGGLEIQRGGNVGYVFTNPTNGTVKYGVRDPSTGQMFFTDTNPWSSEAVNTVDGLSIFTGAAKRSNGDFVPDLAAAFTKPVNIDTADPLLSDSTVAPKDLLALAASGAITGLDDEQAARYKARLQKQEQDRLTANANRDLGLEDSLGIGRQPIPTRGGGGDLSASVQQTVSSITPTVQALFGSPAGKEADFTPPPAPTPPAIGPAMKPGATPTPTPISTPTPKGYNPLPGLAIKPGLKPPPSGASVGGVDPIEAVNKAKKAIQDAKDAKAPDPKPVFGPKPI